MHHKVSGGRKIVLLAAFRTFPALIHAPRIRARTRDFMTSESSLLVNPCRQVADCRRRPFGYKCGDCSGNGERPGERQTHDFLAMPANSSILFAAPLVTIGFGCDPLTCETAICCARLPMRHALVSNVRNGRRAVPATLRKQSQRRGVVKMTVEKDDAPTLDSFDGVVSDSKPSRKRRARSRKTSEDDKKEKKEKKKEKEKEKNISNLDLADSQASSVNVDTDAPILNDTNNQTQDNSNNSMVDNDRSNSSGLKLENQMNESEPSEQRVLSAPDPPKRKRGRPKGSVGWKKRIPVKDKSDADQAMHRVITVPNGMRGIESEPDDFFPELVSVLGKKEMEEQSAEKPSEEEQNMRDLLDYLIDEHLSGFHHSGSFNSLKPFQEKASKVAKCSKCDGEGLMQCEFCKGNCYVDEERCGPPGTMMKCDLGEVLVPEHSDLKGACLCPFCGGLGQERCTSCFGEGIVSNTSGPADTFKDNFMRGNREAITGKQALGWADRDTFIRDNRDRIDIGLDGTIIQRRRARRRRKKGLGKSSSDEGQPEQASTGEHDLSETDSPYGEDSKRRRGRPRRGQTNDDIFPLREADPERLREISLAYELGKKDGLRARKTSGRKARNLAQRKPGTMSTDFLNSTDYQMGLRLRKGNGGTGDKEAVQSDGDNSVNDEKNGSDLEAFADTSGATDE